MDRASFFYFCPGIATWSASCVVDPLSPGNSGGSKGVSPREAPFSIFPAWAKPLQAGVSQPYPFPPGSLPSGQRTAS
jgi:hypothetical protein